MDEEASEEGCVIDVLLWRERRGEEERRKSERGKAKEAAPPVSDFARAIEYVLDAEE